MRLALLSVVVVALAGCGHDIAGLGGGQILNFRNDLTRPVTFFYCPAQGCDRPLSRMVQPGKAWRTASETINGSGAVSIRVGAAMTGCRLVPAVGVLVDPLVTYRASFVRGGPACVRP